MTRHYPVVSLVLFLGAVAVRAEAPGAAYIFPAGGQRGQTVQVRVGGLFLHKTCVFEMLGSGVKASPRLNRTKTTWFEGPILFLPESQRQEDYPQDMAGQVVIARDASLGVRHWRLWTSQGATPSLKFVVGDLAETVEEEMDGAPLPVKVTLPITINGRIFPREDVDCWQFEARKGQTVTCEVCAQRLASSLDPRIEVHDPQGKTIGENDDGLGSDSFFRFTAATDGLHQVRIHDVQFKGGQAYVYRLTITADPYVERVYPLGGKRGANSKFEVAGQGLGAEPVAMQLPAAGPSDYFNRLTINDKTTNPFLLDLDDWAEHLETEPNDQSDLSKPIALPAVLNGRIGKPGDVDYWAITARKNETYQLDLLAGRLDSPLDAVLTLYDAKEKEQRRAESSGPPVLDPSMPWTVPADGTYIVKVEERFKSQGGPSHAYRLKITTPRKDYRLRMPVDAVTVPRAGEGKLRVNVERFGGFNDPIQLQLAGLPQGVVVSGTTIGAGQNTADLSFKEMPAALVGVYHVKINGNAKIDGRTVTQTATLVGARGEQEVDSMLLAVAPLTPFKIVGEHDLRWVARGTLLRRKYHIERNGYQGSLEVCMADKQARHLQGVTGPTIVVPAGVNEFEYAVQLPAWMETGRTSRAVVAAFGVIKDVDGREHVVSYSSVQPSEQLMAIIEPGRLGVEVEQESLLAAPGQTVTLPVRIKRGKGLQGPVKLEMLLPPHMKGIVAEAVTVAENQEVGSLSLRFASECGPFTMPAIIRGTMLNKGEPIIGEAKVEVLQGR